MKLRLDDIPESTVDVHADGHATHEAALPRNGARRDASGIAEKFREQPLLNTLLVALCIATIIVAYSAIGPASQSSGQSTRTTTVTRGVVQSTDPEAAASSPQTSSTSASRRAARSLIST